MIRRLLTPSGGLLALIALWLPWVRLECGTTRVDPNLWKLADAEPKLFGLMIPVALLLIFGLWHLYSRKRRWSVAALVGALAGIGGWIYLLSEKQALVGPQAAAAAGLGGIVAEWVESLQITPTAGFYLYLFGMLIGGAAGAWNAGAESAGPRG